MSRLASKLLEELDETKYITDIDSIIHYKVGLIYSLVQADCDDNPKLNLLGSAYDKHKEVADLFKKELSSVKDSTKQIYYSDTGALFLNLGKKFDRFSEILFKDKINNPWECYEKAVENHNKAIELRKKAFEKNKNSTTALYYARSVENLANTYFTSQSYRSSIEIRNKIFDEIKNIETDDRLTIQLDKMFINQAGCYLIISKSRQLTQKEYYTCVKGLEKIIRKHLDDNNFRKDAMEKLDEIKKLKPKLFLD